MLHSQRHARGHTNQSQLPRAAVAAAAAASRSCRLPGPRRASRLRPQAAQAAPDINLVYTHQQCPAAYIGPVQPTRLKGAGFALEAAKTVTAGELLLISTPIALVARPATDSDGPDAAGDAQQQQQQQLTPLDDDIDSLAEQLAVNSSSRAQQWLRYLDNGNADQQLSRTRQLPDLQALAQAAAGISSSSSSTPEEAADPDEDLLLDIADLNARVLLEDGVLLSLAAAAAAEPAAAAAMEQAGPAEPQTLVGIWPELALLQHSCCPNASAVVHQSAAIVHASRSIPKQGLLFHNLLGPQLLAPLAERRAGLQQQSGIKCMCVRCRDEEKQDPNLLQLVADIYEACMQQVAPELEAAVEADDDEALELLRDQLAAYCEVVDAGFSKLAVRQQSQIWLQASLFKLYELTAIAAAACGEVDVRLLELLAALAAEVSPGSLEHVFWATQYRDEVAADEEAHYDGALREAEQMVYAAYKLRFGGELSRELYMQASEAAQPEED